MDAIQWTLYCASQANPGRHTEVHQVRWQLANLVAKHVHVSPWVFGAEAWVPAILPATV